MATGRCLRIFKGHTNWVSSVSLSADGDLAISGSDDGVRLWEVATGRCLRIFKEYRTLSLSADEHLVLSIGWGKTMCLWEVATGACLRIFEVGLVKSVN